MSEHKELEIQQRWAAFDQQVPELKTRFGAISNELHTACPLDAMFFHIARNLLQGASTVYYGHKEGGSWDDLLADTEKTIVYVKIYLDLFENNQKFRNGEMTTQGAMPDVPCSNPVDYVIVAVERFGEKE